jgi:hypothetical protein
MANQPSAAGARRLDNGRGSESKRAFSKLPRRGRCPAEGKKLKVACDLLGNRSQAATGRTNRLLKFWLQAAQKDPEARRAKHKDESGNLKAEFSFQLS